MAVYQVQDEGDEDVSSQGEAQGGLTSPNILMFPVAMFFDILGLVLNIFFDLNIISDSIAIVIIGLWALNRTGDIAASFKKSNNKTGGANKDIVKKKLKHFRGTLGIKLIPEVGVIMSLFITPWTYRVYKILKD